MCFYLTIAVPAPHAGRIDDVFGHGFQSSPTSNPSVTRAIPAGFEARLITSGMCSCNLYARPRQDRNPAAHLQRKYQKLGWSEAKIQRAIAQAASDAKSNRATSGLRPDVTQRLIRLAEAAGGVAVLVHWYSGGVETERFTIEPAVTCDLNEFPARAQHLNENELLLARGVQHIKQTSTGRARACR